MADDLNFEASADFEQIIDALAKVTEFTDKQRDAFLKMAKSTMKVNQDTDRVTVTMQALVEGLGDVVLTLQEVDGSFEVVTRKITTKTAALKALEEQRKKDVDATKKMSDAQKELERRLDAKEKAAEKNAEKNRQARAKELEEEYRNSIAGRVEQNVRGRTTQERDRLGKAGTPISMKGEADLAILARKVGETAAKIGASAATVDDVFTKAVTGDLKNVDAKYAALVRDVVAYMQRIRQERDKLDVKSKGPELPAPNKNNVEAMRSYVGLFGRLASAATNLGLYRGFNAVTHSLQDAVSSAKELQIEISLIRTLSQDAQQTQSQFQASVLRVSNATGLAAQDVATAFYDLASNQVAAGAAIEGTAMSVARFAKVAKASATDAGNLVSSVLNTFGSDAGTTDEITAKLFKVIDRGRIVAGDLANSFGRVAFNAKDVGLSFEEVGAAMSTVTRAGISSSETMTLVTNVINKLAKPTEQGAKFLRSIGYESGRSAVQALGFTGVMEKLIDATQSGALAQEEFFDEIRGARGFIALKASIRGYADDLKYLQNTQDGVYESALRIRDESPGAQLDIAKNQAKNALIGTFGTMMNNLLGTLLEVGKSQDEVTDKMSRWGKTAAALGLTIGAVVVPLRVLGISQVAYQSVLARMAVLQAADTALKDRNTKATWLQVQANRAQALSAAGMSRNGLLAAATGNPVLAAVGIGLTAYAAYEAYNATLGSSFEKLGTIMSDAARAFDAKQVELQMEMANSATKRLSDRVKELNQQLLTTLAGERVKLTDRLDDVNNKIKEGSGVLKTAFVAAIDAASDRYNKLKQRIGEIPGLIDKSTQAQIAFTDKLNDARNDAVGNFAGEDQQPGFTQQRLDRVRSQRLGIQAEKNLTDERAEEARKLYDEELKLNIQLEQQKFGLQKKAFDKRLDLEMQLRAQNRPQDQTLQQKFQYDQQDEEYKKARQLQFNPAQMDQRLAGLKSERDRFEDIRRSALAAEKATKDLAALDEKDRNARLKALIEQYEKFSVVDGQGEVLSKYKDKDGKLLAEKAQKELEALATAVRTELGPDLMKRLDFGTDVTGKSRSIDQLMGQQAERVKEQIGVLKEIRNNTAVSAGVEKDTKAIEAANKAVEEARKAAKDAAETVLKDLTAMQGGMAESLPGLPDTMDRAFTRDQSGVFGRTIYDLGSVVKGLAGKTSVGAKEAAELAKKFENRGVRLGYLSDARNTTNGRPDVGAIRKEVEGAKADLERVRTIVPQIDALIADPAAKTDDLKALRAFKKELESASRYFDNLETNLKKVEASQLQEQEAVKRAEALAKNTQATESLTDAYRRLTAELMARKGSPEEARKLSEEFEQKRQDEQKKRLKDYKDAELKDQATPRSEIPTAPRDNPFGDKTPLRQGKGFNPNLKPGEKNISAEVGSNFDQSVTIGSMVVNGVEGMDVDALAEAVITKIERGRRAGTTRV